MKHPVLVTRRTIAAAISAAALSAASPQEERRAPARASRIRAAAATVRSRPVPRNISPSFRFIP
jgi:hypothetical protein